MSNVAFLLVVVVISVLGSVALSIRHRKPTTFMSSVDEFQEEMRALGRDADEPGGSGRPGGRSRPVAPPPSRMSPPSAPRRRGRGDEDDQGGGR